MVKHYLILYTAQQFQRKNFDKILNSQKTPNGQAMGVFHELCGERWPQHIGIALLKECAGT